MFIHSKLKITVSDTFTGAYGSEYLRQKVAGEWDIKKAITRANKAAALTIGKLGAQEGIPWANEIDEFDAELNLITLSDDSVDEKISEVTD